MVQLSDREAALLLAMHKAGSSPELAYGFRGMRAWAVIPDAAVRRTVRALARKGMAEYQSPLWSEDGFPAGSGYALTRAGVEEARSRVSGEISK